MITDINQIKTIINGTIRNLYLEGFVTPDSNGDLLPENIYKFSMSEVEGIHTHMDGYGDGVFIRLKDGRVFDKYGDEVQGNTNHFDTVGN